VNKLLSFALALSQRPTVLFSSSFTTVQSMSQCRYLALLLLTDESLDAPITSAPKKEAPVPAEWASITGYMKGKWVAEQLYARASSVAPNGDQLPTNVIRVGQLCGGDNGSWTRAEWFPSLVVTGANLGMLPRCEGSVSTLHEFSQLELNLTNV
jgi:thioester reductase-like protein